MSHEYYILWYVCYNLILYTKTYVSLDGTFSVEMIISLDGYTYVIVMSTV